MIRISPNNVSPNGVGQQIRYFIPEASDLADLRAMARSCFAETFSHRYEDGPFDSFLETVYGDGGSMARDLVDPAISWFCAKSDSQIIAYAKLRALAAPAPNPKKGAMELQQIYVSRQWHATGVADRLMDWALAQAEELGAPEIYLTVFDHNERAKRFYQRYGFSEVGHCTFTLGNRVDDDRVWCRTL